MKHLNCLLPIFMLSSFWVNSQDFKILHYTETSGYDHKTRDASFEMFQNLGIFYNFETHHDTTGQSFNDLNQLKQYKIIVFANTTGDAILDDAQKLNFEQYIVDGGHLIGIHSATDTYRHSSANGLNTGAWDFFAEIIGASVQQDPTHVDGTPFENIFHVTNHAILNEIPNPWYKAEEYYYWQFGYFDSLNNKILLQVDTTVGPNGMINSYDQPRPIAWYKTLVTGNRIFYTSLGHAESNYTTDSIFIRLIANAILWTSGITKTILNNETILTQFEVYPNPFQKKFCIHLNHLLNREEASLKIYDILGKAIYGQKINAYLQEVSLEHLTSGLYFAVLQLNDKRYLQKIICRN